MGTRGAFGFRIGGIDKITYNHWDSYPSGLGQTVVDDLVEVIRHGDSHIGDLLGLVEALRLVKRTDVPTPEQISKCRPWTDLSVSGQSTSDWYCLLRRAQPSEGMFQLLKAGVMIDKHEFMADSLFCEWAYIVNLDEMTFEVYRGFQKAAHASGRYAGLAVEDEYNREHSYHPVALVGTFRLNEIDEWRSTWAAELCEGASE
jgi:hypothetical protein